MAKITAEEKAALIEKAKIKAQEAKHKVARMKSKEPQLYNAPEMTGDPEVDSKADLDEVQASFRERVKMENQRFKNTTDSEYWFAVCFETREQKEKFLKVMDLFVHGDKYLDGKLLAEKLGIDLPDANMTYLPDGKIDKDFIKFT